MHTVCQFKRKRKRQALVSMPLTCPSLPPAPCDAPYCACGPAVPVGKQLNVGCVCEACTEAHWNRVRGTYWFKTGSAAQIAVDGCRLIRWGCACTHVFLLWIPNRCHFLRGVKKQITCHKYNQLQSKSHSVHGLNDETVDRISIKITWECFDAHRNSSSQLQFAKVLYVVYVASAKRTPEVSGWTKS